MNEKRRDHGFLLYGRMVSFLHRRLRGILQRVNLPEEDNCDSLKSFDFVNLELLSNEQFMVKTTFKDRALTVVKGQIDVEKSKNRSGGPREHQQL